MKQCIKCKKTLPKTSEYFYYRNKYRGWFSSWCKFCKIEYRKQNWNKELESQRIRKGNEPQGEKQSSADYSKKYYLNHREQVLKRVKSYRNANLDKVKMRQKEYRKKNRIAIRESKRIYKTERKKTDPCYVLKLRISNLVSLSLKNRNIYKNGKSFWARVGYTPAELFNHIESLFIDGMKWGNRNKWHLDHIMPQSLFYFENMEDMGFKKCWSLDNLQPLWAKENLSKSNHYSSYG